jgi:hypothetical protein
MNPRVNQDASLTLIFAEIDQILSLGDDVRALVAQVEAQLEQEWRGDKPARQT